MIIIGLLGFIGSGKDTVADYLVSKYGFKKLTMSDMVKEELRKNNLPISREEMQKLSIKYKAKHGNGIWAKKCVEYAKKNNWQKIVISGVRDTKELPEFKLGGNFILVFVDADLEIRLNRLQKRDSEKDVKSRTELISQEKREIEIFDLFREYSKYYDYRISNNRDIANLKKETDKFVLKYKLDK